MLKVTNIKRRLSPLLDIPGDGDPNRIGSNSMTLQPRPGTWLKLNLFPERERRKNKQGNRQ